MLVLQREKGDRIVIGKPGLSQVVITVVEVRGNHVRIGVNAEKDIPVHRGEIYRRVYGEDSFVAQGWGGR